MSPHFVSTLCHKLKRVRAGCLRPGGRVQEILNFVASLVAFVERIDRVDGFECFDTFGLLDSFYSLDDSYLATPSTLPLSPVPRLYRSTPPAASVQANRTANRRVGRAVPVTPLRGMTGEPRTRRVKVVRGEGNGAGDGNRTHVRSLGSSYSAIELRPLRELRRIIHCIQQCRNYIRWPLECQEPEKRAREARSEKAAPLVAPCR